MQKPCFFLLLLNIKNIPRLLQGFQSLEFYNLQQIRKGRIYKHHKSQYRVDQPIVILKYSPLH